MSDFYNRERLTEVEHKAMEDMIDFFVSLQQEGISIDSIFTDCTQSCNREIFGRIIDRVSEIFGEYRQEFIFSRTSCETFLRQMSSHAGYINSIAQDDSVEDKFWYLDDIDWYDEIIENLRARGLSDSDIDDCMLVFTRLDLICENGYLSDDNFDKTGQLRIRKLTQQNLNTPLAVTEVASNSSRHLPEGIITRDGTFYTVRSVHDKLVPLLIALGIDVRGAIRVAIDDGQLAFSSFAHLRSVYPYFEDDMVVDITNAQARTMYQFYQGSVLSRFNKGNFLSVLSSSSNLGWNFIGVLSSRRFYNDIIAEENLDKLINYIFEVHPISTRHTDQNIVNFIEKVKVENAYCRTQIQDAVNGT